MDHYHYDEDQEITEEEAVSAAKGCAIVIVSGIIALILIFTALIHVLWINQ